MPDEPLTLNPPAADKPTVDAPPTPADASGQNGGLAVRTFTQAELDAAIKDRLDRAERKHRETQDAAARKAADDAARAQGEWQKLAEQYEPKAKRADALEAFIAALLEDELNSVPEKMKGLVPAFDEPLRKLEWVRSAKAAGVLVTPVAPQTDAGEGRSQPGVAKLSEAEKRERAARLGVDWRYLPD